MKILFTLSFLLCVRLTSLLAATPTENMSSAPPAPDTVQVQLDGLKTLMASRPAEKLSPRAHYRWFDGVARQVTADAWKIIEQHPTDPRRWEAALILQQRRFQPRFVLSIDEQYPQRGEAGVERDVVAAAELEARVVALEKEMRRAADVPLKVREQLASGDLMRLYAPAFEALRTGRTTDVSMIEPAVRGFLERFPESESGRHMLPLFMRIAAKEAEPRSEGELLRSFAGSANHAARAYVADRLRFFALSQEPFELAFTALDGREVDLKRLRGKVVLIDFWATWCGPCIAELPNVRKVYAEYHDQGFEVVGVSLDDEKDRQKFIDLVKAEGTAWPQRFEGKGWKDPLVKAYTISGIPAMFLLDQDGMLVSTNARGEKLGREVKRLLKR